MFNFFSVVRFMLCKLIPRKEDLLYGFLFNSPLNDNMFKKCIVT